MTTLLLSLPLAPAAGAQEYDYVVLGNDGQIASTGRASGSLLPSRAGRTAELVAVVPARALSWHALALPARVASSVLSARADAARARAVLGGALEEQLLDDVDRLHFAVFPGSGADAPVCVAVCDRNWLKGALHSLEVSGHTVSRIVAECEPQMPGDTLPGFAARVLVTEAMVPAQVALCTEAGVTLLPLGAAAISLVQAHSPFELVAEPAVMGLAEQAFGQAANAQTRTQLLAQAGRKGRNLAQFDLSASKSGRAAKRLASAWARLRYAPHWRPVRWGLVVLLLVQVVALNALAYRHAALLNAQRSAINSVMVQTFPNVPVIVDAPVQMQREVQALARSRGAGAADGAELTRLLGAAAEVLGADRPVSGVDYAAGELRLRANSLLESDADNLASALGNPGWTVRLQGDQLIVQARGAN